MAFNISDLTPEQIQKGMACTSLEEFQAFVKDQGLDLEEDEAQAVFEEMYERELSEDELDAVAGGEWCNKCGPLEEAENCTDYVDPYPNVHIRRRKRK